MLSDTTNVRVLEFDMLQSVLSVFFGYQGYYPFSILHISLVIYQGFSALSKSIFCIVWQSSTLIFCQIRVG